MYGAVFFEGYVSLLQANLDFLAPKTKMDGNTEPTVLRKLSWVVDVQNVSKVIAQLCHVILAYRLFVSYVQL